jgi:hypothetical protein
MKRVLGAMVVVVSLPAAGSSQVELGVELRINAYGTGTQTFPYAACDAVGNCTVVWRSHKQPINQNWYSTFARRFSASGTPGAEFVVDNRPSSYSPRVASDPDGNVVVVWEGGDGIMARRYDASGTPQGDNFAVNTSTGQILRRPVVAMDDTGNFVVAWTTRGGDGSRYGYAVSGQRFNAMGQPQGTNFVVNSYTTGNQRRPEVGMSADGRFVIVWQSLPQDGSGYGVFGRQYDAEGAPVGGEFAINSYTTGEQQFPSVAMAADGSFVVVWQGTNELGGSMVGRRYDTTGVALPEFRVDSSGGGSFRCGRRPGPIPGPVVQHPRRGLRRLRPVDGARPHLRRRVRVGRSRHGRQASRFVCRPAHDRDVDVDPQPSKPSAKMKSVEMRPTAPNPRAR